MTEPVRILARSGMRSWWPAVVVGLAMVMPLAAGCGGDGASDPGAGSVDLSASIEASKQPDSAISKAAAARSKGMSGDASKTSK